MAGMEASDDVTTEWAYLSGSLKEGLGDLWPIGEAVHKDVNFAKVLLDIPGYIRHGEAQITCCCIPLVAADLQAHGSYMLTAG